MNVFVPTVFSVMVKEIFDPNVHSANAVLVSLNVFFSALRFLSLPASCVPLSNHIFLERVFFVTIIEIVESYVFIRFASTVPWNNCWPTIKHFTPIISSASSSTKATSIHQISFSILAKAFIVFNFRVRN